MEKIKNLLMLFAVMLSITGAFAFKSSSSKFSPTTFFVDRNASVVITGSGSSTTVTFTLIAPDASKSCKFQSGKVCTITHLGNAVGSETISGNTVTITDNDFALGASNQAYF
jgi:hypothetical protein